MKGPAKYLHKSGMTRNLELKALDVVVNSAGDYRCDAHWRLDSDWAGRLIDYDLWYVTRGLGQMITSDGLIDLYPGQCVWMRPGRRYEATQDPAAMLRVIFIHFHLKKETRLQRPSRFVPPVEVFEPTAPTFFEAALVHVVELRMRYNLPEVAASLLKSVLLEIEADGTRKKPELALNRHHKLMLNPLIAMIRESPEKRWTVKDLAARAGYSTDHFLRLFRESTGQSPKEFMIGQRMERAMAYLKESSHTVSQIADLLGYQDLGFFFAAVQGTCWNWPGSFPAAWGLQMTSRVPKPGWKERLWFLYRFLARMRMFFAGDRIHETPEGERYFVNRYSYVERCISEGGFEKTRAAFLRAQIGPEDLFLDIGANIGLFTILAARREARVESFEPDPFNRRRLRRNIQLNGFNEKLVVVHPVALGNATGQITLNRPLTDNYGMASIISSYAPDGIQVPLQRLDDILTVTSQRYLVKMDVEGAELQVLEGAKVSLEKMKEGSLWLVEVHVTDGVELHAVEARFQQAGYEVSYLDDETGEIKKQAQPGMDVLLLARRI